MSYALETKKRKFDRILESLTDGGSSKAAQSRTSLNSRNNASTTSLLLDTASESSKRRRVTPSSDLPSERASSASLINQYLPSSRTAFLDRLETFRNVMQWHIPSTEPVNASVWAKRGWICVEKDTVYCGSCKEKIIVDLDLSQTSQDNKKAEDLEQEERDTDDSFAIVTEIYDGLVRRYLDMVVTGHAESCPWRKRGCDGSIQRIEGLLNVWNATSALQTRYDSISTYPDEVPEVVDLPNHQQFGNGELRKLRFDNNTELMINPLKLAICGWQRKGEDVIECRYCFRSLGLWLYRGEAPTIAQLDTVDSHLEYCPWRSPEAQDTEITTTVPGENGALHKKEKIAGWLLVCQAIAKSNAKRHASETTRATPVSEASSSHNSNEPLTPEQKEKRMKDLMRRIKELKKPFNVKSLLKRKDKSKIQSSASS